MVASHIYIINHINHHKSLTLGLIQGKIICLSEAFFSEPELLQHKWDHHRGK